MRQTKFTDLAGRDKRLRERISELEATIAKIRECTGHLMSPFHQCIKIREICDAALLKDSA